MSYPASTEDRIFVERYRRESKSIDKTNIPILHPGATDWSEAIDGLCLRLRKADGPIKRAVILKDATQRLRDSQSKDTTHFVLNHYHGKRAATLGFCTMEFGRHPLVGVNEDGVNVFWHRIGCYRNGAVELKSKYSLAFISRHALHRLHERGGDKELCFAETVATLANIAVYASMVNDSPKHFESTMCLRFGDVLAVGSLWNAASAEYPEESFSTYGVRTFLPSDEISERAMVEQGQIAMDVLHRWTTDHNRDPAKCEAMWEQIPHLPLKGNDFIEQNAVKLSKAVTG